MNRVIVLIALATTLMAPAAGLLAAPIRTYSSEQLDQWTGRAGTEAAPAAPVENRAQIAANQTRRM
jgi:hypothetical protein